MSNDRHHEPPEQNPLGLGPRDRGEGSNTGSLEDTMYDAVASDPYTTGEPQKSFGEGERARPARADDPGESRPADPDVPSSDEP